jgi:hypothetical protein
VNGSLGPVAPARILSRWSAPDDPPRLVALATSGASRVKEQQGIGREVLHRDLHDVAGAGQTRMGVPNGSFGLQPALPEPAVREGKELAAVVVLAVLDTNRPPLLEHGDVAPDHRVGSWEPVIPVEVVVRRDKPAERRE